MDYVPFARRPFVVEAVEITAENIAEAAERLGKLCYRDNGEPYIAVDEDVMQKINFVYVGWWLTKMDNHHRAYKPELFHQRFVVINSDNEDVIYEMKDPV